jgi:undecaprenyl diphosphate synthase
MSLLVYAIDSETVNLMKNNVRLGVIGDLEMLPAEVKEKLEGCIEKLKIIQG